MFYSHVKPKKDIEDLNGVHMYEGKLYRVLGQHPTDPDFVLVENEGLIDWDLYVLRYDHQFEFLNVD